MFTCYNPKFSNPKRARNMGKTKKATLTHAEVWDDSALVQSWDDAVEEYQHYWSIHAKGENVDDVLKEAEGTGITPAVGYGDGESAKATDDNATKPENEDVPMTIDDHTSESAPQPSQPVADASSAVSTPAMPMPHPIMANVQDESLKNLMMSWYYAGYYTGLHEGQQQASRDQSS
ncbi:Survival motor neuron [Penicillium expansum]|uniref:Survival motor neuron n=1 Tax=Penicillium expansum TaxID=27334 RepID=A0A0A2JEQ6_PENEN|nr:Survival motor neuron [Penicillium expansum]KGO36451.1 Survival motor neuron [Penicillium expansum]KGO39995.1 Survival motor neuron [Penicillium expansum]KGO53241.1 Survival motor neuron [Penicillium expansum]